MNHSPEEPVRLLDDPNTASELAEALGELRPTAPLPSATQASLAASLGLDPSAGPPGSSAAAGGASTPTSAAVQGGWATSAAGFKALAVVVVVSGAVGGTTLALRHETVRRSSEVGAAGSKPTPLPEAPSSPAALDEAPEDPGPLLGPAAPPAKPPAAPAAEPGPRRPLPRDPASPRSIDKPFVAPESMDASPPVRFEPLSLDAQLTLLEEASRSLRAGEVNAALDRLRRFDQGATNTMLVEERDLLEIEARAQKEPAKARRLANAFLDAYPETVYRHRLQSALDSRLK